MDELDKNIILLIIAQANGTANESELKELQQWLKSDLLHKEIYSEIKAIMCKKPIALTNLETEDAFSQVKKRISRVQNEISTKTKKQIIYVPLKFIAGIAASLILVFMLFRWIDKSEAKIEAVATVTKDCPKGKKLHFSLSDSTEVWLNSDSQLTFPKTFSKKSRNLKLKGEAFFVVARNINKPFIITTSNTKIEVLGTSFNVKNQINSGSTETTVVSGQVDISSSAENHIILGKNESVLVGSNRKLLKKTNVNLESIVDWKDNNLFFSDTPLSEAFKEIELWYNIEIHVKDKTLLQKKIRAKFSNPSLNQLLTHVSEVMKFEYHIKNNTVTIIGSN